jgi:GNAT superfamily N-acetyltransferase
MSRRIVNLTLDTLEDVPRRCRHCVFWELDPVSRERATEVGDPALEKEAWVSATLLDWGSCGKIAYSDGVPAGYIMFSPPVYVPRSVAFPTSPVSPDAVVLMSARVLPEFANGGLGRMLVQSVAKDLVKRGVKAIEAFADLKWEKPACMIPAEFLLSVGFKTVRPHPRYPRLRLEMRSTVSWRSDVEYALEKLLGSMSPQVALGGATRSASN